MRDMCVVLFVKLFVNWNAFFFATTVAIAIIVVICRCCSFISFPQFLQILFFVYHDSPSHDYAHDSHAPLPQSMNESENGLSAFHRGHSQCGFKTDNKPKTEINEIRNGGKKCAKKSENCAKPFKQTVVIAVLCCVFVFVNYFSCISLN